METCSQSFAYKDPDSFMNMMGFDMNNMEQLKVQAPLLADGLRLYKVFTEFTTEYVDWAYASDAELQACTECVAYWKQLNDGRMIGSFAGKSRKTEWDGAYKYGLKDTITKDELAKQLGHLMFYVTGYHRVVGNFADYLESGSKSLACVIREGMDEGSVLDYFGISTLAAFTGFPQINLINDWSHVFLTDGKTAKQKTELQTILDRWQSKLRSLSVTIETESQSRPIKQHMMNPRHLDSSIAI